MRLLFIRSTKAFSGAERYNINLVGELKKRKDFDISFVTNLPELARKLNAKCYPWLPVEVGTKKQLLQVLFSSIIFIPLYISMVTRWDLVVLESRTEMIFLTPVLRIMGKKVVWIQHGPLFRSQASHLVLRLYRWASRFVTKIIAVSEDTKTDLVTGGVVVDKVRMIYIGVPLPKIEKHSHPFTIGFLGTVTREKGIDTFVRFVTKNKVRAFVIGDGPDGGMIPKSIKRTGFVEDVYPYLSQIDVLFLPTRHQEGISMAILEAMSAGIPVMTTDIGGNHEIIRDGYNGLLLRHENSFDLKKDWKAMGQHARATITNKFSITKQVKVFASFFRSL